MQLALDLKSGNKIDDVVEYILNSDNRRFNKIIITLKNPKGDLDIRYQREIIQNLDNRVYEKTRTLLFEEREEKKSSNSIRERW